jgi:hypothetical protein
MPKNGKNHKKLKSPDSKIRILQMVTRERQQNMISVGIKHHQQEKEICP